MILLLGTPGNESIRHLSSEMAKIEQDYFILDSQRLFKDYSFSYCPNRNDGFINNGFRTVALSKFSSAFWGQINVPELPKENASLPRGLEITDLNERLYQQELNCSLQTLLNFSRIHWCNSWQAFQLHKTKPIQLEKAKALGAVIPKTQISNVLPHESVCSASSQSGIMKPVHAGYMTQAFDVQHDPQTLITESCTNVDLIKGFPFTLQDKVLGQNIRTYVIGEEVFSGLIETKLLDFRSQSAEEQIVHRIQLSEQEKSLAQKIRISFDMQWTAIDWIRRKNGELVFLEANPAPMFIGFERLTSYPITKALMKLLLSRH